MRIAIGHHEIGRVLSGRQRFFLRRDRGAFRRVQPGDALWLAEPFHLETRFDGRAPTAARDLGAVPVFAGDQPGALPGPTYGKRHPARALCRQWHRYHVVIETRTALPLQQLADADLIALGFSSVADFAIHWDRESSLIGGRGFQWRDNPEVLRFGFALNRAPLPDCVSEPRESRERRGAWCEPARPPVVAAARTGECPRCGARLAAGCIHHPLPAEAAT
jgi:hypothetical protein